MPVLTRIRELPWYLQVLLYSAVAVGLFAAGELLPYSPVKQKLEEKAQKEADKERLTNEVQGLEVLQSRAREFEGRIQALEQQLLASKAIIPDEKRVDDFMRSIQESVVNAQIAIRRLTSKPVVYQPDYAEMPIEIEVDGAFYSMLDFYERLARLTRVVNVGELKLDSIDAKGVAKKYVYIPGTSVAGTCLLTTYYTASEAELAAAAPATRGAPGRGPAGPPAGPPR